MAIFEDFDNLGKVKTDLEEYHHPIVEDEKPKDVLEEELESKRHFGFLNILILIIFLVFFGRLVGLQIISGLENFYLAEGNRLRIRYSPAPRGNIIDASGESLTKNIAKFNLEIYPNDLPRSKDERQKIYSKIAEVVGLDSQQVEKDIEPKRLTLDSIVIKEGLSHDESLLYQIKLADTAGVQVAARPNRQYLTDLGLGHLLGYVGKINQKQLKEKPNLRFSSVIGQTGLEAIYEDNLEGRDGEERIEVDAKGRLQRAVSSEPPLPGSNLNLHLSKKLQGIVYNALKAEISQIGASRAAVVVLDPNTGGVKAMVSLPDFDNNIFGFARNQEEYQKIIDNPNKPFLNRAISGLYPSGSSIKPAIASAGLQEKVITPQTTINDPGEIRVGDFVFPDWKAHGLTNVYKAIAESCNVFFYHVGAGFGNFKGLGANLMAKYLKLFGYGQRLGIDLPGEQEGLVPTPDWKKKVKKEPWYIGDSYHLAIGQGDILVTPLQMADMAAAIANGGTLYKPQLVDSASNSAGKKIKEYPPQVVRKDFIDSQNIDVVQEAMRQTVASGTARKLNDLPVTSAGKTGTAQFGSPDEGKTHAWYIGFAPYENPQIAFAIIVEGGGEGSDVAASIAKKILAEYFQ